MELNTQQFKSLLEEEKKVLEGELATLGRKNPANSADWEATEPDIDVDAADENVVADGIEEYENNKGILEQLETRLNEVIVALDKIEHSTYGMCETCKQPIESDRLEANPAAKTCKMHMND